MMVKIAKTGCVTVLILFFIATSGLLAKENKTEAKNKDAGVATAEPREAVVSREIEGTVNALGGNFLAVDYGNDEKTGAQLEMAFTLDGKERITHKKSIKEINAGDSIKVMFDELYSVKADGSKAYVKRITRNIVFLRAAEKKIEPKEALVSGQESKLESESQTPPPAEPRGPIPLKGLKGE